MACLVLYVTVPYLQLYTEYISNFDKALKVLEESCRKNRAFGELVREFEVHKMYILPYIHRCAMRTPVLPMYLCELQSDIANFDSIAFTA